MLGRIGERGGYPSGELEGLSLPWAMKTLTSFLQPNSHPHPLGPSYRSFKKRAREFERIKGAQKSIRAYAERRKIYYGCISAKIRQKPWK